jgi:methyl-accepting chemotaxis protein
MSCLLLGLIWAYGVDRGEEGKSEPVQESCNELELLKSRYWREMNECAHQEIFGIQTELGQIKRVIGDAIMTLTQSFNGIHEVASQQTETVRRLLSDLSQPMESEPSEGDSEAGKVNFINLYSRTEAVLRCFIDYVLLISKHSMQMVAIIDEVDS